MAEVISDEDVDNMALCTKNSSFSATMPENEEKLSLAGSLSCKPTQISQHFKEAVTSRGDYFENCLEKCEYFTERYQNSNWRQLGYILPILFSAFFLPNELKYLLLTIILYILMLQRKFIWPTIFKSQKQIRTLKWHVDDFPDKVKSEFLSSPTFNGAECQWRLIVKQKTCAGSRMNKYSIGIILVHISKKFRFVTATAQFELSNSNQDLIPELKELTFVQPFESEGDCGFSEYVNITLNPNNASLSIKCRLTILPQPIDVFTKVIALITPFYQLNTIQKESRQVFEVGTVVPEQEDSRILGYDKISTTLGSVEDVITAFLHHPETKSFMWKIPDALQILENGRVEYWDILSPSFVLCSNGVCSIWRMKFVEIHGVLRLHLQLRGLPKRISQLKVRYTVEILDNFGDFIAPEQCSSSAKYADYLRLWDSTRMPLYSLDAFMKRFLSTCPGIHLRISIQVDPLETNVLYPVEY